MLGLVRQGSDLHCNGESSLNCLEASVKNLQAEPPDVMLLLGDFGERIDLLPETFSVLAQLSGRFGTYWVRGNHDFEGGRATRVEKLAKSHGLHILRDEVVEFYSGKLALVGMERPWLSRNLPPSSSAAFAIGLTHTPDNIVFFDRLNVRLGFAGHTHGGKLRLPLIGPILVPSLYGRVFDQGWYCHGRAFLYLTPGIGYFPGWLGHVGEIVRVNLRRA